MNALQIYLTFNGNAREALNFYKECFGGEIVSMQTFGEAPMPAPKGHENDLIHADFSAGDLKFMVSDSMPGQPVNSGDNVSLTISCANQAEQDRVFTLLSQGGKVTMPLQDTFWNARFGMVKDKYGINWMLNLPKQ